MVVMTKTTKCCSMCREYKLLKNFRKSSKYESGYFHKCRECSNIMRAKGLNANGSKSNKMNTESTPDGSWITGGDEWLY